MDGLRHNPREGSPSPSVGLVHHYRGTKRARISNEDVEDGDIKNDHNAGVDGTPADPVDVDLVLEYKEMPNTGIRVPEGEVLPTVKHRLLKILRRQDKVTKHLPAINNRLLDAIDILSPKELTNGRAILAVYRSIASGALKAVAKSKTAEREKYDRENKGPLSKGSKAEKLHFETLADRKACDESAATDVDMAQRLIWDLEVDMGI